MWRLGHQTPIHTLGIHPRATPSEIEIGTRDLIDSLARSKYSSTRNNPPHSQVQDFRMWTPTAAFPLRRPFTGRLCLPGKSKTTSAESSIRMRGGLDFSDLQGCRRRILPAELWLSHLGAGEGDGMDRLFWGTRLASRPAFLRKQAVPSATPGTHSPRL